MFAFDFGFPLLARFLDHSRILRQDPLRSFPVSSIRITMLRRNDGRVMIESIMSGDCVDGRMGGRGRGETG